jgi:hypothetical protein
MRVNYQGVVNDRPLDTMVVSQVENDYPPPRVNKPNFMDNVLAQMNNHRVVPVASVPRYDKGLVS